jgi:uncharacterized protein YndB with AHSA1/START domain
MAFSASGMDHENAERRTESPGSSQYERNQCGFLLRRIARDMATERVSDQEGTLVADNSGMRSVVDLEINAPREIVAELYSDPNNNPKWMDDLERNEPISGVLGEPGSKYRMVSKDSDMHFVVTVVSVYLPENVRLHLEWKQSTVDINVDFIQLDVGLTRFISTEDFAFTGFRARLLGLLGRRAIKSAHRRHMEGFKRFAERQGVVAEQRSR